MNALSHTAHACWNSPFTRSEDGRSDRFRTVTVGESGTAVDVVLPPGDGVQSRREVLSIPERLSRSERIWIHC